MHKMKFIILLFTIINLIISIDGLKKNKIIGGKKASIEMFYSQVSLRWQQSHLCAGTIISPTHILTVASCIILEPNVFISNIEILSGTNDQLDASNPVYLTEVFSVIYHPDYNLKDFWINDISILKLTKPLLYSRFRLNSDLPYEPHKTNIKFRISGWGNTDEYQIYQQTTRYLQYTIAKVFNRQKCLKNLKFMSLLLSESQSCAIIIENNGGLLNGDAGGGIIDMDDVYGIISVRMPFKNDIFIFTQVWQYVDWIEKIIYNN